MALPEQALTLSVRDKRESHRAIMPALLFCCPFREAPAFCA